LPELRAQARLARSALAQHSGKAIIKKQMALPTGPSARIAGIGAPHRTLINRFVLIVLSGWRNWYTQPCEARCKAGQLLADLIILAKRAARCA
jgi:hypothetical protein